MTKLKYWLLALTFIIPCQAGDFILSRPNRPSRNFNVFKRQLVVHNADRLLDKYLEDKKRTKRVIEATKALGDKVKVSTKLNEDVRLRYGSRLEKGVVYANLVIRQGYVVDQEADFVVGYYQLALKGVIDNTTLSYKKDLYKSDAAINIVYRIIW